MNLEPRTQGVLGKNEALHTLNRQEAPNAKLRSVLRRWEMALGMRLGLGIKVKVRFSSFSTPRKILKIPWNPFPNSDSN